MGKSDQVPVVWSPDLMEYVVNAGAVLDADAIPCHTLQLDQPTIIVLGSEGSGLRKNVELVCSGTVKIGVSETLPQGIDSLNVSVAAGILVHHFMTSKGSVLTREDSVLSIKSNEI